MGTPGEGVPPNVHCTAVDFGEKVTLAFLDHRPSTQNSKKKRVLRLFSFYPIQAPGLAL